MEAIKYFSFAIKIDKEFIKAYVNWAECYYLLEKYEECLLDYDKL